MAIDETIDALRRAGYKITSARRVVITVLHEAVGHMTAPELVEAVRVRDAGIGRASVYRTLDLLTTLGLVQASTLGGTTTTYVLTPSGHHHHIVCLNCRDTIEFDRCLIGEFEQQLAHDAGFHVEGHLLEIYGLCADCRPSSTWASAEGG